MAAEPQRQPWPYNWTAYIVNILTEIKMNASGTMRKITGLANGSSGTYDGCNVKQMEDHVAAAIGDMIDKGEVDAATTAALPANTRTANVLKADVVGAFPTIDGVAASLNNTYLVKNEGGGASHINNGLYTLTVLGDGATEWELTRNSNLTGGDLAAGAYIHIQQGADPDITYRCVNNTSSDIVNTDALEWKFWGQTVDHAYLKNITWSSAGHIMDKYFAGKCVDEATGDNTNGDGTFAYPYKTYQKAIDVSLDNEIYIIAAPNVASQAVSVPAGKKVYIMLLQGSDSLGSTGQITTLTLAEGSLFSGKSIDILAFNDSAVATFAHVYMENGEISTVTSGSTKTIFELHGTTIDSATWTYLNINAAGLNGNANVKNVFTSKDGFDANSNKVINVTDPIAAQDAATKAFLLSQNIKVPEIGTATYNDIQDILNNTLASSYVDGGLMTPDGAAGNVAISDVKGYIRKVDTSGIVELFSFDISGITISAGAASGDIIDLTTNYLYVDYTTNTIVATVTQSDVDGRKRIGLGKVFRNGTDLRILQAGMNATEMFKRIQSRENACQGDIVRTSGMAVSDEANENFKVTDGIFYAGYTEDTTPAVDTSGLGTFEEIYNDGAWQGTTSKQKINITQYNNYGVGLVALTNNYYSNRWIYMDIDGHALCVIGQGQYLKLADAEEEGLPLAAYGHLADMSMLVARITIKEGVSAFVQITSAFENTFAASAVSVHNELSGLNVGDYQHLTAANAALVPTALQNLVEDLTPQLGGELDLNNKTLTAKAATDIILKMGDAAGANKVSFTDNADVEVLSVDSDGTLTGTASSSRVKSDTGDIILQVGDATGAQKVSIRDSGDVEQAYIDSDGGTKITELTGGAGNDLPIKLGDAAGANKLSITDSADAEITSIDSNGLTTTKELTAPSGQDLKLTAPSGQDNIIKMGDAAGANKTRLTDNADVEVLSVDSDGTITGTQTDATLESAAGDVVLKVGDAAGAKDVSIQDNGGNEVAKITSDGGLASIPDEITATNAGIAASVTTMNTEVTTNGDSDLDNVTLANGVSGQVKHIYCVAVGNAADSLKITPANMVGGTQITFAANPLGKGCTLVYADNEGWVVIAENGGTVS